MLLTGRLSTLHTQEYAHTLGGSFVEDQHKETFRQYYFPAPQRFDSDLISDARELSIERVKGWLNLRETLQSTSDSETVFETF